MLERHAEFRRLRGNGFQKFDQVRPQRLRRLVEDRWIAGIRHPDRLRQALDNLIGNAVRVSPPGAEVEVALPGRFAVSPALIWAVQEIPGVLAAEEM